MRRSLLVAVPVLICLACCLGYGQWVESTIYLPDSLTGADGPCVIVYNPCNGTCYVGGYERGLVAFEAATGRKVAVIPVDEDIAVMCCNPVSNKIYVAGYGTDDGFLTIIDGRTNTVVANPHLPGDPACLTWNPVENCVYYGNDDSGPALNVIDGVSNQIITSIVTPDEDPMSLCSRPDGSKIYCATDYAIDVVDCATHTVRTRIPLGMDSASLVFNPRNNRLYCTFDTAIAVIDGTTDSLLRVLTLPLCEPWLLAFDSVGNRIFCSNQNDDQVFVIDCARDTVLGAFSSGAWITGLCVNPSQKRIYVMNDDKYEIRIFDSGTFEERAVIQMVGEPAGMSCTPSGDRLFAVDYDHDLVVAIDGAGDSVRSRIILNDLPRTFVFDPIQDRIWVAGQYSGDLTVVDGATSRVLARVRSGTSPRAGCVGAANDRVYFANYDDDSVAMFSGQTNLPIGRVGVGDYPRALCWDSSDNRVFTANYGSRDVSVLDGAQGVVIATIPVGNRPYDICYNAAQNKVYCVNYSDSSVSIIDAAQNRVISTARTPRKPKALVYDATDSKVYCACRYGVVAISGLGDSIMARIQTDTSSAALCYNPVANKVYSINTASGRVTIIDAATDRIVATLAVGANPGAACCNPTSNLVYVTNEGGNSVTVIDGASDRILSTVAVQELPAYIICNPLDNRIYVANAGRSSISILRDPIASQPLAGISGPLFVKGEVTLLGTQPATVFDLSGRKCAELKLGVNDLHRLSAGVYFVHWRTGRKTAKIVVHR